MQKPFTRFSLLAVVTLLTAGYVNAQTIEEKESPPEPETQELRTVTITRKKPLIETKNGKVIINVSSSILAAGSSALEILAKAPGVSVSREGRISLNGKNGVNIMINGKLTYLSGEQLTSLLRATSGNTIETIEMMSNPSSRYDASGSAGIINIRLKKNSSYGTNGSMTAGGGYGRFYKSNAGISLNHRTQKFNIYGSYDYLNNKQFEDLSLKRSNISDQEVTLFRQQGRDMTTLKNNTYKAGLDYLLSQQQTIGLMVNGYMNNNQQTTHNTTLIGHQQLQTDSAIRAFNPGHSLYRSMTYNLNYKASLDTAGQELTADMDYSRFRTNNEITYHNYFYTGNDEVYRSPLTYRNAAPSTVKIRAAKIDYAYPVTAGLKLETGIKSSDVRTDNDFQFENLSNDTWVNDASRSNRFIYKEQVNAAYFNLNKVFKTTTLQIGLRVEMTGSEGNSATLQQTVKRNYTDFFPSLSFNQALSAEHAAGFSYSRRIDRPDYQSLNPFIYFNDLYTYSEGNPFLNPQYTNSFELSYGYHKTFNATLGYSHTKDVMTTTLITDTLKKTIFIKEQNLAAQQTVNLNMSMPLVLTDWWNMSNNVTIYHRSFSSPDLMGLPFHSGKTSYLLSTLQSLRLSKTISTELSFNYQSAQVYGTYAVRPLYSTDLGISKSFAGKRAMLKLAANDVFNSMKARISSTVPGQDYQLLQKQESRIFRLTFSYNFGSSLIKAVTDHKNGSSTEKNRIKTSN